MDRVKLWQNICAKVLGVVGRITFAGLTLLLLAALANSDARAAEVSFADFPFLIACEAGGTQARLLFIQNWPRRSCRLYDACQAGGHDNAKRQCKTGGRRLFGALARERTLSSCVLWAVHSRPLFAR